MELLEFRRAHRITWRQLAARTGVPHSNLNAIAHGKRECSMETARKIEDATDGAVTTNDINRVRRHFLLTSDPRASLEASVDAA
ncbi:MAG TPA: hypothetical protein DHW63_05945 [Hyphomonadaceae bacterium]|nr:hypothetical protein [Hyphomonadaceae bacterium]